MSIEEGMKLVDRIIMRPRPEQALPELIEAAKPRAVAQNTLYAWDTCKTQYTENSHEVVIWQLSLMYAEYLAGLLALKAAEGHCQTNTHVPCKTMANAHMYIFNAFKNSLEALVKEMGELEQRVRDKTENLTKLGPEVAKELGLKKD